MPVFFEPPEPDCTVPTWTIVFARPGDGEPLRRVVFTSYAEAVGWWLATASERAREAARAG